MPDSRSESPQQLFSSRREMPRSGGNSSKWNESRPDRRPPSRRRDRPRPPSKPRRQALSARRGGAAHRHQARARRGTLPGGHGSWSWCIANCLHAFIDDPPRLLEEHIAPKLFAALAEDTELHDLSCEIEVVLNGAGTWHFRLARGKASLEKGSSTKPAVIL